jgi:cysteinyl-tRNA synthetase
MLTGSLTLEGIKMSKSLGNTLTVEEALHRWRPQAIRTFVLSSHYRSPIDFSEEAVNAAEKGWQRLWGAVQLVRSQRASAPEGDVQEEVQAMLQEARRNFEEKMDDDFNAPAALGVLQELTRDVNTMLNEDRALSSDSLRAMDDLYRRLAGDVLGLIPDEPQRGASVEREEGLIRLLIGLRAEARANREWAKADQIRDRLGELGVMLEDRPDETIWKIVN